AGELEVLANCAVLTEGYDEPRTDGIVMARPTKSRALYTQCVGPGTHRHTDKDDCLILDVVGATEMHSLVTVPSLFGLEGDFAKRMGDDSAVITDTIADFKAEQVRLGLIRAEEADLFRQVRSGSKIVWLTAHREGAARRRYVRPLPADQAGNQRPTVVIAQREDGSWNAGLLMPDNSKQ